MLESALKFIKIIEDKGFKAYIVGGFVRDYILGIDSSDIDINTNATPKDIKMIFEDSFLPSEDYGSVTINKWGIRFEITTFREEISYIDNRRPAEIRYIDDLEKDLLRRDFTINTICMNSNGEIVDLLHGSDDIEKGVIRTVKDASLSFEEDSLRILRAIRFATVLDFRLDEEVVRAIDEKKHLLRGLSYYRKREELDKIFTSCNAKKGILLLLKFNLDKELELERLKDVTSTDNLIGIWSVLDVCSKYPFNSNELSLIKNIKLALNLNNLDPLALYTYGLYVNTVAGEIKGLDKKKIAESYNNIPIQSRKDLAVSSEEILEALEKEPGKYLKEIFDDIIHEVLYRKIPNEREAILDYIVRKYKD